MAHPQRKAVGNLERVLLGAPFALEDGVLHVVAGVYGAQTTQVNDGHRTAQEDGPMSN